MLDESHPHCVRDNEGQLVLSADPAQTSADLAREVEWRRRTARAGCLTTPLGGVLGLSAGLLVGLQIDGPLTLAASLLVGAVLGFALALRRPWPPPAGPPPPAGHVEPIHPFLVEHAPGDAAYDRLHGWQRAFSEYAAATAYLRRARIDTGLDGAPEAVSPGDLTTWVYSPADLPGLEDRYAAARDVVCRVAAELGVEPPPEQL